MPLRGHAWLAFLSLWPLACANTPNNVRPLVDASHPVDRPVVKDAACSADPVLHDASGPQCKWLLALDDNCVPGCKPTRAYVTCTEPGASVSYPASEFMGCLSSCSGTCQDFCAVTEFALACDVPQPDAAASTTPTQGCHPAFTLPLGGEVYCCPCQ